jgi:hypothetical protein
MPVRTQQPILNIMHLRVVNACTTQVRDLGRAALLAGDAPGGRVGKKELDEWARSSLDVMEDSTGHTSVKDLTYIEVCIPCGWRLKLPRK